MTERYFIPAGTGTAEYREKRSRFLGRIQCVHSEQEARVALEAVRREHRDARHNCWCWRLHGGSEKYSDDGEPQGTAGLPMLTLLQRRNVENVICIVTRYFGGILLGTGGLLRAYTQAAGEALDAAGIAEMQPVRILHVRIPYRNLARVREAASSFGAEERNVEYMQEVRLKLEVPEEKAEAFLQRLTDLLGTNAFLLEQEAGEAPLLHKK